MIKAFAPIFKIGFAALLATTFISCNQGAGTTSITPDSLSTANVAPSIVYVNSDSLLTHYEYFKEINTTLEAKAKKAQDDLQSRSLAFQREIADYQQNAGTMSAADRQSTEERLARKQDELARHQQNASASFAQDEAEEMEKLYTRITDYLKAHAQENGYQYVLTYSTSNPAVLYADSSLEITSEVVKALNDAYAKEKSAN